MILDETKEKNLLILKVIGFIIVFFLLGVLFYLDYKFGNYYCDTHNIPRNFTLSIISCDFSIEIALFLFILEVLIGLFIINVICKLVKK